MDYLFKPIVLVTGFGPFVNHPVNASWEAVQRINKEQLERKHDIELVLLEIPVTYQNVDEFVPALWETHEPKLMIHVGVSSIATQITIETQAHRKGYQRLDYFNERPANHTCTAEGAIRLHTKLNVERICKEYNECNPEEKTTAVSSLDAGRYLCEYIYYTSLSHDNTRTLFVHVPDTQIYSSDQTAKGLERIIDLCMKQLAEVEDANSLTEKMDNANICDNETMSLISSTASGDQFDVSSTDYSIHTPDSKLSWDKITSESKITKVSTITERSSVTDSSKLKSFSKPLVIHSSHSRDMPQGAKKENNIISHEDSKKPKEQELDTISDDKWKINEKNIEINTINVKEKPKDVKNSSKGAKNAGKDSKVTTKDAKMDVDEKVNVGSTIRPVPNVNEVHLETLVQNALDHRTEVRNFIAATEEDLENRSRYDPPRLRQCSMF